MILPVYPRKPGTIGGQMTKTNQCQIEFICHSPDLCKYFEPSKYDKDLENNCCYAANIGDLQYNCECDSAINESMLDMMGGF